MNFRKWLWNAKGSLLAIACMAATFVVGVTAFAVNIFIPNNRLLQFYMKFFDMVVDFYEKRD